MGSSVLGLLFVKVLYCFGDLRRDPNLENYPDLSYVLRREDLLHKSGHTKLFVGHARRLGRYSVLKEYWAVRQRL